MPNRVPYAKNSPAGIPVARPNDRRQAESKRERDEFYNRARWIAYRKWFLSKHPLCEDCLDRDEVTPATIPHHVQERLVRPDLAFTESNLWALCSSCHSRIHKAGDGSRSTGGPSKS